MADRNQQNEQSSSKAPKSAQSDQNTLPDDGIRQNPDPDSQKSGAARPRGHTEEPDRTL